MSILKIHGVCFISISQFFEALRLSNPPTTRPFCPSIFFGSAPFCPAECPWVIALGTFANPAPPTNPEIRSTTELVTKKFMEDGANLEIFCFNKKWAVKGKSPEQITQHIFSGKFSNMIPTSTLFSHADLFDMSLSGILLTKEAILKKDLHT